MNETLSVPAKNPSMASVAERQVTKAETVSLLSDKLPYEEKIFWENFIPIVSWFSA